LVKNLYILLICFLISCGPAVRQDQITMNWTQFDLDLPDGIDIFHGKNKEIPLKAWVAKIDLSNPKIKVGVLSSNDADRRETPLQFSKNFGASLVLNGGYFLMDKVPAQHVGLLKTNGILEEPASHSVFREGLRYFVNRGAFGVDGHGGVDIAWCSTKNDSIFEWPAPIENRPGHPADSLIFSAATHWNMKEGVHGGPVLIHDGKINITVEEEAFFNTPIAGVQPRSAIGYTKDNQLIMLVVDGRQQESRGVYLEELAMIMQKFECIEVLNLDGGGSSAMVADSRLLNRPAGRTLQREVMSAIGIFYYE